MTTAQDKSSKSVSKTVNGGIVNGQALSLPMPEYPAEEAAKVSGTVDVQVTIDEQGNIFSALAVSGPLALRELAEQAAWQAKFKPTRISGQPVKVTGTLVYTFVAPGDNSFETKISKAEKVKILTLAMTLYTLNEIGSEPNLESTASESINAFGELSVELQPLRKLQGLSSEQKIEIIGKVITNIGPRVSGSDVWQFEMGKQFASIAVQMHKYKENNFKGKVDETKLQNSLMKIREMTYSAPPDIPTDFLDGIRKITDVADKTEVMGGEKLVSLAYKMFQLFQIITPK
jgi:TonB family protein